MRVSQFEIYRLIQRAMEALGAGYGVDRDAARAVAWLEARALPGLAAFDAELPRLEAGLPLARLQSRGESELVIEAGGSAIASAGAVLDLATTVGRLRLQGCTTPLFLIPGAADAAKNHPLSLAWQIAAGNVLLTFSGGPNLFLPPGTEVRSALLAEPQGDVVIERATAMPPELAPALTAETLAARLDESLNKGIAGAPALWRRLDAVAARIQVPASETSRERGAGGGDANT
ncbi:MAG TPA: DUF3726 domain-containing protein [Dongiaceae bacterium]|jgi:hypothetical protein